MVDATSSASSVSTVDVLSTLKNIVTAINAQTQANINIAGAQDFYGLTTATVVKGSGGRIVRVSVIVAGSAPGHIYDATSLTDTSRPLWVIPNSLGVADVSLPASYGIVVVPGTGMTVSGSYS